MPKILLPSDLLLTWLYDPRPLLYIHKERLPLDTPCPLERSDHDMVYLVPVYKQKLKSETPAVKSVKQWTDPAIETLQDCFDCTDWDMFKESACDINEYTDTVCSYINVCENMCIPTKNVKVCANDKPWCNGAVRQKLREEEVAFQSDDKGARNKAKRNVEKCIKIVYGGSPPYSSKWRTFYHNRVGVKTK